MIRGLGTLVAGVVVGLLVGYWSEATLRAPAEPPAATPASIVTDDGLAADPAAVGASEKAQPRSQSPEPRVDRASAVGEILGVVVDRQGTPIPGVSVSAQPARVQRSLHFDMLALPLSEFLDDLRAVRTQANGSFRIPVADHRKWELTASRRGYEFSWGGEEQQARAGDYVRLVGSPRAERVLDVRFPDGTQADRATLFLSNDTQLQWRSDSPALSLPSEAAWVTAQVEERFSSPRHMLNGSGPVRLQLEASSEVRVSVELRGMSQGYVHVYWATADSMPPGTAAELHLKALGQSAGLQLWEGASLVGLVPGLYVIGIAMGDEGPVVATQSVHVTADVTQVDFTIDPPLTSGVVVTLRAKGGRYESCESCRLFAVEERGGAPSNRREVAGDTVQLSDGRALFLPAIGSAGLARVARGRNLILEVERNAAPTLTLDASSQEIVTDVGRDCHVLVTVPGDYDYRYDVHIVERGAYIDDGQQCDSSQDGTYSWHGPPGNYDVVLSHDDHEVSRQRLLVAEQTEQLTLSPGATFTVTVAGLGEHSTLMSVDTGCTWSLDDYAAGEPAIFELVPAGRYLVSDDESVMELQVVGDLNTTFVAKPINAILYLGPTVAAGLHNGDVILGYGGERFTGVERAYEMFIAMIFSRRFEITVRRDGRTHAVFLEHDAPSLYPMRSYYRSGGRLFGVHR